MDWCLSGSGRKCNSDYYFFFPVDVYWTAADETATTRHGVWPPHGSWAWAGESGCSKIN